MIKNIKIQLPEFSKGFHLITRKIMENIDEFPENGLMHIFIQHTSAALTLNENADPSVRHDLNKIFDKIVPENQAFYTHTSEGPDDMPAHAKSILCGSSVSIPIINSRLAPGNWQGIYLCEFRQDAGPRNLIISIYS